MLVQEEGGGSDLLEHLALLLFGVYICCQMVLACFKHPEQPPLCGEFCARFSSDMEKKSLLGHISKENQFLQFSTRFLVRPSVTILH